MKRKCFLFLKREYFDLFANGEKSIEWRAWKHQFTDKTYHAGRAIELRAGYSKDAPRLYGVIIKTDRVPRAEAPDVARSIYPDAQEFCAIYIEIRKGKKS